MWFCEEWIGVVGGGSVGGGECSGGSGGTCQKKILDLVKYPLSFSLPISPSTLNFVFFWRAHREFVCNLKGGKVIRDRRDAIRGRNSRTIGTNTRSFSSGDRQKPK